jgi:hypothetical protein
LRADDIRALLQELDLEPVVREAYIAFFDESLAELRLDGIRAGTREYEAQPRHLAIALELTAISSSGDASSTRPSSVDGP